MSRLRARLAAWGWRPLLERPVLVEIELAVYPDGSVRLNDLNQVLAPEDARRAGAAMVNAIAVWAARHGAIQGGE